MNLHLEIKSGQRVAASLKGNHSVLLYYLFNASELCSDKKDGLSWEWLYKKGIQYKTLVEKDVM
jgi:hypothetical protein